MICSSENRFFTSNLRRLGNWTPNRRATQNRGDVGAIATNKKRRLRSEACFDLNTMGLIPVDSSGEWLWWWFQGIDLGRLSDGSNVPQINNPDIAPLVVPLPPLAEQAYIVECLQTALQGVVEQECAVNISLKQSAAQRKNILKAAFSGQLVPQDPNDEPASVLLERIRAERAKRAVIKKPRRRSPREDA
jgi:type I restriction enzyme S subunit